MTQYGPPERVHVELDRYDGPRSGIADIMGRPHRFTSLYDDTEENPLGTFLIWPIDETMLALEVEQWRIFVKWDELYEAGEAGTDSHPGTGGVSARWDEIELLLKEDRAETPATAQKALANHEWLDRETRYAPDGPDYMLRWLVL